MRGSLASLVVASYAEGFESVIVNAMQKTPDSASVANQLNEQFSKGTGVLTRIVKKCNENEHPCEMWKLKKANSFLLMHPYSWSKKKNHYVGFSGGRTYGWPGFIAAPNVLESMVTCSWPKDADIYHRNFDEPIGSTPKRCGCRYGGCSQPDGADWCDVEPHTPEDCAYRPDATATMLEQFKADGGGDSQKNGNPKFNGYNEVLVDADQWAKALPKSVLAFVIPRDCAEGSECYSSFADWYADWIDKFGPWPIVHFDAKKKDAPYSPLPQPLLPPPHPMPSGSLTLRALQWMPGRSCFDDAAGCGNPAQARLRKMLTSDDVDLANIIGLSDTDNFQPPPHYTMITGQCPLATGNVDSASIIWNTDRWQWLRTEQNGCMVTLDHVYTIQRFKHVASSRTMLVVGANYPHGIAAADVDAEIVKALKRILDPHMPVNSLQGAFDPQMQVLLMANTNLEPAGEGTTDAILKRLTHRSGASVGDAIKTCCGNEVPEYTHSYDRIGLTGGSDPYAYPQPAHGQLAMTTAPVGFGAKIHVHKPLLASFTLAVWPPQPMPPHPVPPHPVPGGKLTLQALQWNPHWEVFSTPACAMAANNQLDIVLEQFQVDFANIVMLNEDQQHPQYKPKSGWDIAVTSKCEAPDSTVLIYNSDRWIDLGVLPFKETNGMCMVTSPKSDRPFATQVFKHKVSSQKVLVVGAHYPHPSPSTANSDDKLKQAIELEMQRMKETGQLKATENLPVLFMADTNVEAAQESTQSFLRRLTGRDGVAALPQNGQWKTCCENDGYHHEYDRIGLTGPATVPFSGLLFSTPQDRQWASGCNIGSFHKAVVASFELQHAPPSPPPKPPNPPYRESECGVTAMANYKNTFGRRCSAVETNSGQCMFDYRSSEGRPCSGFFCNANGVDGDCGWCLYDRAKCNSVYTDGSCNHDRPMCRSPTPPQVQEVTV